MRKLPRDTMTARQRVEATLRGELPDRVPIFDLIQHVPLIEHVTGEKITPANGLDLLCRTIGERLDITRGIAPPAEERKCTKLFEPGIGSLRKAAGSNAVVISGLRRSGMRDTIPRNKSARFSSKRARRSWL